MLQVSKKYIVYTLPLESLDLPTYARKILYFYILELSVHKTYYQSIASHFSFSIIQVNHFRWYICQN